MSKKVTDNNNLEEIRTPPTENIPFSDTSHRSSIFENPLGYQQRIKQWQKVPFQYNLMNNMEKASKQNMNQTSLLFDHRRSPIIFENIQNKQETKQQMLVIQQLADIDKKAYSSHDKKEEYGTIYNHQNTDQVLIETSDDDDIKTLSDKSQNYNDFDDNNQEQQSSCESQSSQNSKDEKHLNIQWLIKRNHKVLNSSQIDNDNGNSILNIVQHDSSQLEPNSIEIGNRCKLNEMNPHEAKEWLTQAIDQYRINKLVKKQNQSQPLQLMIQNKLSKFFVQKMDDHKECDSKNKKNIKKSLGLSRSYINQRQQKMTVYQNADQQLYQELGKSEQFVKKTIKSINYNMLHLKEEDILIAPTITEIKNIQCESCKIINGQCSFEMIKVQKQIFVIAKYFEHPKANNNEGQLMLNIYSYSTINTNPEPLAQILKGRRAGNILQGKYQLSLTKSIFINKQVTQDCINPNYIQFLQNGRQIYYFKVRKNKQNDIIELNKYNMVQKQNKKIKQFTINKTSNESDNQMKVLSVLICHRNELITNKLYINKEHKEQQIIDDMFIIVVFYQQDTNEMLLSFRALKNIQKNIYQITIHKVLNLLNCPHIISSNELKQNFKCKIYKDLEFLFNNQTFILAIGYYSNSQIQSSQQYIKIIHIDQEQLCHDSCQYPETFQQIEYESNQAIKNLAYLIYTYFYKMSNNQQYIKYTGDINRQGYVQMYDNQNVIQNILKILQERFEKKQHNNENEQYSYSSRLPSIVFNDCFMRKLIILKCCPKTKKPIIFQIDYNAPSQSIAFEQILSKSCAVKTNLYESPMIRLFKNNKFKQFNNITLTYEFDNLCRDRNKIYCFDADQIISIYDPYHEFKELTGCLTIISEKMKQLCSKNKLNLDINTIKSELTNTLLYYDNNFQDQIMFQAKNQKLTSLLIENQQHENNEIMELSDKPFTLKEYNKEENGSNSESEGSSDDMKQKNKYQYKLIPQSTIFKEDDRKDQPFVIVQSKESQIMNIWITIFNLQQNKLKAQNLLNLNQKELQNINNIQDIKLSQSSSIEFIPQTQNTNNNNHVDNIFIQTFSICILFNKLMRFKIYEYQIEWAINEGHSHIHIKLIGRKEFIGSNMLDDQNLLSYHFIPKLNQKFQIIGNIILMKYGTNQNKQIYSLDKLNYDNAFYKRRLTISQYKVFNPQFDNEFLLVEVNFSKYVMKHLDHFNDYEQNAILNRQIKTILNMVPVNFINFIEATPENDFIDNYDWFQNLEALNGFCIIDHFQFEPEYVSVFIKKLKTIIPSKDIVYQGLLEVAINNQQCSHDKNTRQEIFDQILLLRPKYEVSSDLFQISIIERCIMLDNERSLIVANHVIDHLYDFNSQHHLQEERLMLTKILAHLPTIKYSCKSYFNFINDQSHSKNSFDKCCYINQRLNLKQSIDITQHFQYQLKEHIQINYQTLNQIGKVNVEDLIIKQIKHDIKKQNINNKKEQSKERMGIYIIDLRHHILEQKLINFRSKSNDQLLLQNIDEIIYTETNLARDILGILDKSQDLIEEQEIIRQLIDSQFPLTKKLYKILFYFYLFGFCLPFIIQRFSSNDIIIKLCILVMLINQLLMSAIEIFQMIDVGFWEYFSDFWNINDLTLLLLTWTYCFIRLNIFNIGLWQDSFINVRNMEFQETHIESEIILQQLKHLNNQTYLSDNWDEQLEQMSENDYQLQQGYSVYIIVIFNTVMLIQMYLKILFYLRVFDGFRRQVQLIFQVTQDLIPFLAFFFCWIILFSLLFRMLSMEIAQDDYYGFNLFIQYAIFVYRNAIGDVQTPTYNYWLNQSNYHYNLAWVIISIIWMIWLVNQIINLIILLNCLISLVGESYNKTMSARIINRYNHKAALNYECRVMIQAFGAIKTFDFLVVSHQIHEKETQISSIHEISQNLKTFIKEENTKVLDKIQEYQNQQTKKVTDIEDSIKTVRLEVKEVNSKLDYLINNQQQNINYK